MQNLNSLRCNNSFLYLLSPLMSLTITKENYFNLDLFSNQMRFSSNFELVKSCI